MGEIWTLKFMKFTGLHTNSTHRNILQDILLKSSKIKGKERILKTAKQGCY